LDTDLLISLIINIVLLILTTYLGISRNKIHEKLNLTNHKLKLLESLIVTFKEATKDGYVSPTEARTLVEKIEELIKDP